MPPAAAAGRISAEERSSARRRARARWSSNSGERAVRSSGLLSFPMRLISITCARILGSFFFVLVELAEDLLQLRGRVRVAP
jgi:hypothetical protein